MAYKEIPDISTFDGSTDFAKMKKAGYAGVIIRAGYGQTNVDAYYHEHIQGALEAGLPVGIYWFSYAWSVEMAEKEAEMCISLMKDYDITLPVFWDFEYDSDRYAKAQGHPVSNLTINQMAVAFCSKIRKAGYIPGIYFNKDYKSNRFDKNILKSYVQWYAYYNKSLDVDDNEVDLWQFTSTGDVAGIPAADEDISYLINENLLKAAGTRKTDKADAETILKTKDYIKGLQAALKASYNIKMPVDGKYGKLTESAVTLYYLYYTRPTIKNAHVSWLQDALYRLGYKTDVDGSYGPDTQRIVKVFQEEFDLIVDGWAGPGTHRKIIDVMKEVIG